MPIIVPSSSTLLARYRIAGLVLSVVLACTLSALVLTPWSGHTAGAAPRATDTDTPTATASITTTDTPTPTSTATLTATITLTATDTATPTATASITATDTTTPTPTDTTTPTDTPTSTTTPTDTATPTPTATATPALPVFTGSVALSAAYGWPSTVFTTTTVVTNTGGPAELALYFQSVPPETTFVSAEGAFAVYGDATHTRVVGVSWVGPLGAGALHTVTLIVAPQWTSVAALFVRSEAGVYVAGNPAWRAELVLGVGRRVYMPTGKHQWAGPTPPPTATATRTSTATRTPTATPTRTPGAIMTRVVAGTSVAIESNGTTVTESYQGGGTFYLYPDWYWALAERAHIPSANTYYTSRTYLTFYPSLPGDAMVVSASVTFIRLSLFSTDLWGIHAGTWTEPMTFNQWMAWNTAAPLTTFMRQGQAYGEPVLVPLPSEAVPVGTGPTRLLVRNMNELVVLPEFQSRTFEFTRTITLTVYYRR